jgi:membrane protease YdiL (CAAX protease family)
VKNLKIFIPIKITLFFYSILLSFGILLAIFIKNPNLYTFLFLIIFIFAGIFTFAFTKKRYNINICFETPKINLLILFSLLGCSSLLVITNIVDIQFNYFFHTTNNVIKPIANSQFIDIINYIEALLIAPIIEELVFRKFCFDATKGQTNPLSTLIISSALFGFAHPSSLNKIISAFLSGLILGSIYLLTQNIIYSIIAHMSSNIIVSILDILDSSKIKINNAPVATLVHGYLFFNNILFFIALIISILSAIMLVHYHNKNKLYKLQ